ncbi:MAG: hypothetical protein A2Y75_03950 [Candidatus Solincola sediminis]|uniref:Uncharacterized protein n=1 Tax=Candidatus Solincola sediminis TaxID=1797199 RepID=A0A1F2WHQ7_9ACTN|nr:MAG: hypothetical protein A2Y75_03950 [Candidatus Solincola sediminis]
MKKIWIATLSAIIVVCLLCASCGNGGATPPADAAQTFVLYAITGDYEAARALVCTSSLDEFDVLAEEPMSPDEKNENREQFNKMHFQPGQQSADTAIVYITHVDYPGNTQSITLTKEDGVWKVDLASSGFITEARESALKQQCLAQMRNALAAAEIYAASENSYPVSWNALIPDYLEAKPACPSDGSAYLVEWSRTQRPEIKCPNHGSVDQE